LWRRQSARLDGKRFCSSRRNSPAACAYRVLHDAAKPRDAFRTEKSQVRFFAFRTCRSEADARIARALAPAAMILYSRIWRLRLAPKGDGRRGNSSSRQSYGFAEAALGINILRTETAVCAALAVRGNTLRRIPRMDDLEECAEQRRRSLLPSAASAKPYSDATMNSASVHPPSGANRNRQNFAITESSPPGGEGSSNSRIGFAPARSESKKRTCDFSVAERVPRLRPHRAAPVRAGGGTVAPTRAESFFHLAAAALPTPQPIPSRCAPQPAERFHPLRVRWLSRSPIRNGRI